VGVKYSLADVVGHGLQNKKSGRGVRERGVVSVLQRTGSGDFERRAEELECRFEGSMFLDTPDRGIFIEQR
jgi:hypothetical protein